jgi:Glucose-6-phosphate dehydrogenase, NAD binding domain
MRSSCSGSGDLTKEMTFRSLYRLEHRGLLGCPIVGVAVDDWTFADLRRHLRSTIRASGETVERMAFDRLAVRFALVTLVRPENDCDLHVVLQNGPRTMIGAAPAAACTSRAIRRFSHAMASRRSASCE